MSGKITPRDNSSNLKNANKGTVGTNTQYDKAQGNRGTQLAGGKPAKPPVGAPAKK